MARNDLIEMKNCTVLDCLPAAKFKVQIPKGPIITATLSGKLRMNKIRILGGDVVTVELSPYDLTKGIITWRTVE